MGNDARTLEVLLRLKEIGVRLAVDDFGTGNTTFHYLKNFPLTTIKIDKSFTGGIANDSMDAAITKALLAMAHRLHLTWSPLEWRTRLNSASSERTIAARLRRTCSEDPFLRTKSFEC